MSEEDAGWPGDGSVQVGQSGQRGGFPASPGATHVNQEVRCAPQKCNPSKRLLSELQLLLKGCVPRERGACLPAGSGWVSCGVSGRALRRRQVFQWYAVPEQI